MTIPIITFKDFDLGVFLTLGAELVQYEVDGVMRNGYAIDLTNKSDFPFKVKTNIPQLDGKIPVFFTTPEDVFQPFLLPCFVVVSNSPEPAFDRSAWYGWTRKPSNDAKEVTIHDKTRNFSATGFDKYDVAWKDIPFNMSYDLQVMARNRNNGIGMLTWVLKRFTPPYCSTMVYDSIGDKRLYDTGTISVSNMSELADISDRTLAWTISFEVRGEISLVSQGEHQMNDGEGTLITKYPDLELNFIGLEGL